MMIEPHLERVESNKVEGTSKILLICGIGSLILLVLKIFLQTQSSAGFWFDIVLVLILSGYMLIQRQKLLKARKGQYIEWLADKIVFKIKPNLNQIEIFITDISRVSVGLDEIEIFIINGSSYRLDISDFDNYNDRMRIKENFSAIAFAQ